MTDRGGSVARRWTGVVCVGLLLAACSRSQAQATPPAAAGPVVRVGVGGLAGDVERGRYLAERVAMCVECHSDRNARGNILDPERYLGAPIPFKPPWPNDWAVRAPRIRGLPGYDDAQAMRLLTEGAIGRDGQQLKPPMPRFRMTPQDAADVIAFLRVAH